MRRRAGIACVALGAMAVFFALSAPVAAAATPKKVGWWFQLQSGPLALPVPLPTVPDGGIFVQQGASGPLAYGALEYTVAQGSSSTLTLTAAPGSVTVGATMQACRTTSAWEATSGPGAWEARPSFANPCAPGIAAADGSAVAFNLNASFVENGTLDVAIVPTAAATPFAVAFQPPDDGALERAGGKVSTSPPLPPKPTAPAGTGGSSPAAGGAATVPTGAPVAAKPAAPPAADTSARSTVADDVLNIAGLGDPDRGERAVALSGAALIVVGWWLLSTRTMPMPKLLVGLTGGEAGASARAVPEDRVGGVGRFARQRSSRPNLLR